MKTLIYLMILTLTVSCGGSGSGTTSGTNTVKEAIFTDSAVTSFTQTGGVAHNKPSLMDNVFPSAYAVSGNIRCVTGAPVAFSLDALGNTVQVDTTCNDNMDLNIRRGLLESMAGKRILGSRANGTSILSEGRVITFNASGSFWSTYENVVSGNSNNGHNEQLCRDKFTFDETAGTVTIELDQTNSLLAGADTIQDCLNVQFNGATANDYKTILPFRFKDGKLQLDGLGTTNFVDSNILEFCIDNNSNSVCD
jgi:hypothetical protein